jgi:hypothetical protein
MLKFVKYTPYLMLFLFIDCDLSAQKTDCELFKKEFIVYASDFPQFESMIESFYNDSNTYDYLYMKIVGGGKQKSELIRVFKKKRPLVLFYTKESIN